MNHPLKIRHWVFREWMCYFFGHKWVHANTAKTPYYDKEQHEVPYEYRVRGRGRGNYMWDSISWWSSKCTRCREKTIEFATDPWYKGVYWGIKGGFRDGFRTLKDKDYLLWKRIMSAIPLTILSIWKHIALHMDTLPDTLWIVPAELEYFIWGWMEKDVQY